MDTCFPCLPKTGNLCGSQLALATTFFSLHTKRKIKIYHEINCKSEYVIYLMEYIKCSKQYLGKAGTACNIRLNHHRRYQNTKQY